MSNKMPTCHARCPGVKQDAKMPSEIPRSQTRCPAGCPDVQQDKKI